MVLHIKRLSKPSEFCLLPHNSCLGKPDGIVGTKPASPFEAACHNGVMADLLIWKLGVGREGLSGGLAIGPGLSI